MADDAQPNAANHKSTISLIVAVTGALLYVAASWYLLRVFAMDKPLPEMSWQRALIIFNGIASVGFACIGVLLGSSVQQISLAGAKADAAQKANTIKEAMEKLRGPVKAGPSDVGGGPMSEESRAQEAYQILLKGLN